MNGSDEVLPPRILRSMQMVAAALLMGVLVFLSFSLYTVLLQNGGEGKAPVQGLPVVSLVAAGMLVICAPLSVLVPGVLTRTALQHIVAGTWRLPPGADPEQFATVTGKLLAIRQTTMIVGLALLEGSAFTGCIAYLLEGQVLVLGVIGVAILLMLLKFPTVGRVRSWLERQADVLAELRQEKE